MSTVVPTIIALDECHCAACGRPYPFAAAAYRASVLALLTPAELAALDTYTARALDNPAARPGDAVERAVLARVDTLLGGRRPRARPPWRGGTTRRREGGRSR